MKTLIDLHVHSTASDGIRAPADLVAYAANMGIGALALTDHDTTDGIDEALAEAARAGVDLVPGIEFSVDYHPGSFHMVGLYIDHRNEQLQEIIHWLKERRSTRIYRIIDDLRKHRIDIPVEEVEALAAGGSPGRPHVARVLVKHGFAENVKDVFQKYLVYGKPGFVKKEKVSPETALAAIIDAGGVPILAHPVSLECATRRDFEYLLAGLVERGLKGLEAYASMHTKEDVAYYLDVAEKRGLLVTGGSDYHGDKNEKIGWYAEDSPIPSDLYQKLREYRRSMNG